MKRFLTALLVALTLPPALGRPPVTHAQAGSGRVARALLDALTQDDLDAAIALMVSEPELQAPDGELLQGAEAVRRRPSPPAPLPPAGEGLGVRARDR